MRNGCARSWKRPISSSYTIRSRPRSWRFAPNRRGKWIWRCHIDVSRPYRQVWNYLRQWVAPYDASIFSLAAFAQPLSHNVYIIPPSIDALSEKNIELTDDEIAKHHAAVWHRPRKGR